MHFRFEDEFISAYIKSLEMNIEEYLMDGNMDIIDYMISTAEKILSKKNYN